MTQPHALIIDDNLTNIQVLAMLLDSEGVTQTAIASPHNLWEILDQIGQLDVIFLDLEIPNYDGFQVFEELKGHARLEQVPIVAYTVHTSEIDAARRVGFHSFLGKPLNTSRFPAQLRRILDGQPVWEA